MTPSGIEPATFRFVVQRLNQLGHGDSVRYGTEFITELAMWPLHLGAEMN